MNVFANGPINLRRPLLDEEFQIRQLPRNLAHEGLVGVGNS